MKKIYSTPELKVVDIDVQDVLQSMSVKDDFADEKNGMDANKRESSDGLFDW